MKQFDDLRSLSQLRDQLRPYWIDDLRSYANIGDSATVGATLTDISAAIAAHRLEADPHPTYLTATEADALFLTPSEVSGLYYSKASLDGGALDARYYTKSESESRYVNVTGDTMIGQLTFSPPSAMAPIVLSVNAQGQLVSGFNADQLDGYDSAAFPRKTENATISGSWIFGVDLALASAAQIDFADVAEDKIYWYSKSYGTGVEGSTLTHWSAANHRWRVGGTSASTGTQEMILNSTGLQIGASSGTASAALDVTGSALISGQITVGSDTDATSILGRGKLYSGFTDELLIAHFDHANTTDYALRQNSLADTVLNAATGRSIYHRINNADTMVMNVDRLNPAGSILKDLGDYNRKWRTLYASELYVETLVAQDVISTIGGRVMITPTTKLIADLASGATTIDVEHNNLVNGEYIYMSSAPGGVAQVEAMKITSAATAITGGYRYSLTRNLDGSGANNWVAGDAVASLGATVGSGYIDLTATSTIHGHAGPTMAIYQRTSTGTWNGTKPSVAIGNLRSFVDYSSDTAGIAHGNDLTLTPTGGFSGMTSDNTNGLRLFNTALSMYISGAKSAEFTTGGGVNFYVLGNNTVDSARSVSFIDTSAKEIGKLGAYYFSASGIHGLYLSSAGVNGRINQSYFAAVALDTTAGTGKQSLVRVSSESYGGTDQGLMAGLWLSANKVTTAQSYIDLGFSQSVPGTANTDGVINLRAGYVTLSSSILNSNDGIRLSAGSGWTGYASATASEIANDLGGYDALMIAGNKAADSVNRRVNLYDKIFVNTLIEVGQGRSSSNISNITGRYSTSAGISLTTAPWGYSSALLFQAYHATNPTGGLVASGACKYLGAQYTGNVTRPAQLRWDGNSGYLQFAYGEAGLANEDDITTWTEVWRSGTAGFKIAGNVGFYNTTPVAKQTVTGSRGGNAALASLLTALAAYGLITNSSTA